MDNKNHWSKIYQTKGADQVSWYQTSPALSLYMIQRTGIALDEPIIDVGAGASTLVDHLLTMNYQNITLLDLSAEALQIARSRVSDRSVALTWLEGDVTAISLPEHHYAVWHDRAVFHFLTDADARRRYINQVSRSVKPGGHVIIATFALDGPEKCSGLDVVRYDVSSLHAEFGDHFKLLWDTNKTHHTPWGTEQQFIYCYCRIQPNTTASEPSS